MVFPPRFLAFFSFAIVLLTPLSASAAIPFWGPIIPTAYNVCAADWALVLVVINNIIALLITLAITIVAPVMIAWAGFDMIMNPTSAEKRSQAKKRMLNVIAGIVLALASWMIIAALMAVLYRPQDPRLAGITWTELITTTGSRACIPIKAALNQDTSGNPITGVTPDGSIVTPDNPSTGFSYDPDIAAQIPTQSAALSTLLSCMKGNLPAGVGRISSISDSVIMNGSKTFAQCAASRVCSHAAS